MRILITGATGLIGSHITRLCLENGTEVHYLTTSKSKIEKRPNYKGFYWNPEEGEIDATSFEGVDAIIHLAGATIAKRWTTSYKKEIIDSRVKSADLLFKSLQGSGYSIAQFISASAIGIYPSSLEKLYSEDENSIDDSFLGQVVERWEAAADQFKDLNMKVAKVRIGLVLAEGGGALPKIKIPASLNASAAFGSGEQWQSWIHIRDLAGVFYFVMENGLEGIYNAVAPNPVTNEELTELIARELNKAKWLPNIPEGALKLAMGEMAIVVLASQRVSSEKIENAGYHFKFNNLRPALKDLL